MSSLFRRAAHESRQQGATRVGARAPHLRAGGQRDLVGPRIALQTRRAGRKGESCDGVDRTRALGADIVKPDHWRLGRRLPRPAVALRAGALEHDLAALFQFVQRRICVGQWRSGGSGLRQLAHPGVREQHLLKRRKVVEQPLRRRVLDLRVIDQCAERLILERCHPSVQLISAGLVRTPRPGIDSVWSRQLHVIDARYRAPDVRDRLARRLVGCRIDEPDVCRQRQHDSNQAVPSKIAEVTGIVSVGAEIVGVDGAEERIIGVRIPSWLSIGSRLRVELGRRFGGQRPNRFSQSKRSVDASDVRRQ